MKDLNYYKRKCFIIIASYGLALNACVIANFITGNSRLFLPLIAIILVVMEFEAMSYTKHKKEFQKQDENKYYIIDMKDQTLKEVIHRDADNVNAETSYRTIYDLNKYIITFSSNDLTVKRVPSKYVYFGDSQKLYINPKAENNDIEYWSGIDSYITNNGSDNDLIQIYDISMENLSEFLKKGDINDE